MKRLFFQVIVMSCLFYSSAEAAVLEWSELREAIEFQLRHDLTLSNGVAFRTGERFRLAHEEGLPAPGFPMVHQELISATCADPGAATDEPTIVTNVTIDLKPGCRIGVYIEASDFYRPSLFENVERP